MEPCPFEDAFPNIDTGSVHKGWTTQGGSGFPYVGGTDSKPTREERRAARKRAKKCKGPVGTYEALKTGEEGESLSVSPTDPDRPAAVRFAEVGSLQDEKEAFVLPVLPKASCLFSDTGTPKYFGRSEEDAVEEGYSSFSAVVGDDSGYRLEPDVTKTFDLKGAAKAGGETLPEPNLSDTWKPMTPAASYTAFLKDLPTAGSAVPGWAMDVGPRRNAGPMEHAAVEDVVPSRVASSPSLPPSGPVVPAGGNPKEDRDILLARIDALMGRLEDLERKKKQDSQSEILLFVGTGLFLLFSFDLVSRR